VRAGDLADPASLEPALAGAGAVFLVWPFLDAEAAPAALEAIGRHTGRVVYLSTLGVREGEARQADLITGFHAELERRIAGAGLEWTFLRPSGFAANTLAWADELAESARVRVPYPAGRRSLIHERDIAAVAVRALLDEGHVGATHRITGPEALDAYAQLRAIGESTGRALELEETPPETAREELAAWLPPDGIDGVLGVWAGFVEAPEAVTGEVERITGRPARPFSEWARDHAADFSAQPVT
jgi:uncharacterized protein YbjT (DUF2867 family)